MTPAFWFWIIYVLSLIPGWFGWDRSRPYWFAYPVVVYILIGLLGLAVFGFPVKGHA